MPTNPRPAPTSFGKSEPIMTADGKKRYIVERIDIPWDMNGRTGIAHLVRVQAANMDRDGDTRNKKSYNIDVSVADAVGKAMIKLAKLEGSNEGTEKDFKK